MNAENSVFEKIGLLLNDLYSNGVSVQVIILSQSSYDTLMNELEKMGGGFADEIRQAKIPAYRGVPIAVLINYKDQYIKII